MSCKDFINRLKLPFQKDGELRRSLYDILGFLPGDIKLYKQALMHKSAYGRKYQGQKQNNERLEFLGDAVLDAVVGDIVYHHFKGKSEGFLTNTRSKIVQRESLNKIGLEIGIDKLVRSSDAVHNTHNSNLLGNAFEALVGAVYEDRGYDACMRFMERRILKSLVNIDKVAYKEVNFKSKLLEWSQKNRVRVNFDLVKEGKEGTASPTFETDLVIEGVNCGTGRGYSKKESQQMAAREALKNLKQHTELEEAVFLAKSRRTAMDERPESMLPDVPVDDIPTPDTDTQVADKAEEAQEPAKRKRRQRKKKVAEQASTDSTVTETKESPDTGETKEQPKRQKENSRQRRQRKARKNTENSDQQTEE
ncbi:MAG: ribonuclease III [Bacteroidaceae bacterium]|nr:ribonuclease III [Bacteroidaceae bacterium]